VVAFRHRIELGSQATPVGVNTSYRDAAFCTLVDAMELARDIMNTALSNSVTIYMADHQIIPWCLIMDGHDNALACRAHREMLSTILFNHPNANISIRWILGTASFHPLKCLLEVATAAAAFDPAKLPNPPTIVALKATAKTQALSDWEQIWLADPHQNPTYWALHHPPSGQLLEFISRIESFAWPIFCTTIQYDYSPNMLSQGNTM
jgi:hypothetical protein